MAGTSRASEPMFASMWEKIDGVPPLQHGALKNSCLAEWQLLQPLGKGEFAEVQACRRQGESTTYVCKHICKARLVKPSNVRHTLRRVRRVGAEITAMRLVRNHPHICEILDVFHTPDFVHIVMEFGGRDLYEVSNERAPHRLSAHLVKMVAYSIASGIGYCQEYGIVHRDLKPENVLIRESPKDPEARGISLPPPLPAPSHRPRSFPHQRPSDPCSALPRSSSP